MLLTQTGDRVAFRRSRRDGRTFCVSRVADGGFLERNPTSKIRALGIRNRYCQASCILDRSVVGWPKGLSRNALPSH